MEVGLKMALRAAGRRYGWEGEVGGDVGVIGLRGGYHGDTVRLQSFLTDSLYPGEEVEQQSSRPNRISLIVSRSKRK